MNVKMLSVLIVLCCLLVVGCTQAKDAWAATIPDDALSAAGWVEQGEAQYQTLDRDVAGMTVSVNLATQTYVDASLTQKLLDDAINNASALIDNEFSVLPSSQREGLKNEVASSIQEQMSQYAAAIHTVRVVLPAGIPVPDSLMEKLIDGLVQNAVNSIEGLKNLKKVSETEFTTESGKSAKASIYDASIGVGGQSADVKLLACHWNDAGSTIVVIGVYPYGEFTYPLDITAGGMSVKREFVAASIDEGKMRQEVLSLIEKVR
ncbi:MAG: DUF6517 family protein [Methermicoccaceae archaeon]